ncbi:MULTISPECIES: pilus assembly protein [unclassified Paenibacillus]|uniref:TadE/TadG family type IV pilus assembly protein n=1 Tax=unclassified Paenibacillus TaxID=185978 RepID=UPI001AE4A47D|nr:MULTISPECIES: pilus assembly protein [unclassified Paenibacillus]MBP1155493.1 hypothetical protein [Paenibacillus sp. PvP091]MBP1169121.1 hypothetical protein [Paenibacillus sp. PvR098]MBP2440149.1 hypothetical protein [Paenibacillus sp. PvP052]
MRFMKDQQGSIVLEAALTLPFFIAFVTLLTAFIRLSLTEMALQSAVSESAKVIAANMYPVEQLYREGQSQWSNSQASVWIGNVVAQADTARQKVLDAEVFVERYERWIPEPLVDLVEWEQQRREQLEAMGSLAAANARESLERQLAKAATPIIASFAETDRLETEKLLVTQLTFPDLDNHEEAYVTIEAQYEYTFAVPFFKKTILLRKQALERAWVGGGA